MKNQGRRKRGGLGRLTFWPLTPFDYERTGSLGTTRTLLRCTGSVELLCLSSETSSRSVPAGYADKTGHTLFSRRTHGLTLASQSTRHSVHFTFRPPHPPYPSYGPENCNMMFISCLALTRWNNEGRAPCSCCS